MNDQEDELQQVKAMLERLLSLAHEVQADMGAMPTAEEALEWAIGEVDTLLARRAQPSAGIAPLAPVEGKRPPPPHLQLVRGADE